MDKEQLRKQVSEKMKLIRVEYGYTQNRMADVLGLSKKTLVQIEKERTLAGWTTVVAVCALFQDSEILKAQLGDAPLEITETIAHKTVDRSPVTSIDSKVWWNVISENERYLLEQNVISQHYRILDRDRYRLFSGMDYAEAVEKYEHLSQKK
ncbi:helix-turn-helix domain-containing protein [Halobacillus fulvus]|nr:helix-turn-helix domain-containing protein [Halobacillus fulvus]